MNRRAFLTVAASGIIVPRFEPIYRKLWVPRAPGWNSWPQGLIDITEYVAVIRPGNGEPIGRGRVPAGCTIRGRESLTFDWGPYTVSRTDLPFDATQQFTP